MEKPKLYFSHPYFRRVQGRLLCAYLKDQFGGALDIINPFDHDSTQQWMQNPELQSATRVVNKDFDLINKSTIILSLLTEDTIGTPMEVFYASLPRNIREEISKSLGSADATKIPIIGIAKGRHPWLQALNVKTLIDPELSDMTRAIKEVLKDE